MSVTGSTFIAGSTRNRAITPLSRVNVNRGGIGLLRVELRLVVRGVFTVRSVRFAGTTSASARRSAGGKRLSRLGPRLDDANRPARSQSAPVTRRSDRAKRPFTEPPTQVDESANFSPGAGRPTRGRLCPPGNGR